jgi:hypothetical protein
MRDQHSAAPRAVWAGRQLKIAKMQLHRARRRAAPAAGGLAVYKDPAAEQALAEAAGSKSAAAGELAALECSSPPGVLPPRACTRASRGRAHRLLAMSCTRGPRLDLLLWFSSVPVCGVWLIATYSCTRPPFWDRV